MQDSLPLKSPHLKDLKKVFGPIEDASGLQRIALQWLQPTEHRQATEQYLRRGRKIVSKLKALRSLVYGGDATSIGEYDLNYDLLKMTFEIDGRPGMHIPLVLRLIAEKIDAQLEEVASDRGWYNVRVSTVLVALLLIEYHDLGGVLTVAGTEPENTNNKTFHFVRKFAEIIGKISRNTVGFDAEHLVLLDDLQRREPAAWVTLLRDAVQLAKRMMFEMPNGYEIRGGRVIPLPPRMA